MDRIEQYCYNIYVNKIKNQFMKSIIAFSVMTILLLSVTVLGHNTSSQIAYAQTISGAATLPGFNFAAAGDWGCTPQTINTVNNTVDKNPELIVGLGDYPYEDTADCWFEIVKPIDDIMKIAFGNEDLQGSILTDLMEHFNLTNQYYSFDYQNVHFTVMDDYIPDEIGSEQYIFVQNDLAQAASDPNIDWIIAVHHRNAYSSTANSVISGAFGQWKEAYHPLFEQYNVDLVLQGHHHSYQRSYPIKYNVDTSRNPIITDENTNNYTNPEGQIFLTVGTGGAGLHPLYGNKAPYLITAQEEHGFLNVDVTNNNNDGTTTLVGTFYSNNGGEMTDQFTIAKSAAGDVSLSSPPSPSPPPPSPPPELPAQEEPDILDDGDDGGDGDDGDDDDDGDGGG
jgi:hypothetical protein